MNRLRAAALPLLALLLAAPALAGWSDIPSTDFALAAPPAPGSPEYARDFEELLKLQAARTPEQCSAAAAQAIPDFRSLFGASGILSKAEAEAVAPFVDRASKFLSKVSGYHKKKFSRPRPFNADPRVQPCVEKPSGSTSYPSTHAAAGVLDACVLGRLFPERAGILGSHGRDAGQLRLVSGVHHPSDVAAGQDLGARVCARLLKEDDFLAELASVKSSLP
ncbi:MAG: phosphatase PAP2 family protein [Elusimicrobia bacterium]|nr:phosphatase PAP2 family protein [Elusimicrobiota bacterium]